MKIFSITLFVSALIYHHFVHPVIVTGALFVHPETGHRIYLLGDFHEDHGLAPLQQKQFLNWAKQVNAIVIVEDVFEFSGESPNFRGKTCKSCFFSFAQQALINSQQFLLGLKILCDKHNIEVYNVEIRMDLHEDRLDLHRPSQMADMIDNIVMNELEKTKNTWIYKNAYHAVYFSSAVKNALEGGDFFESLSPFLSQEVRSQRATLTKKEKIEWYKKITFHVMSYFTDARIASAILFAKNDKPIVVAAGAGHTNEIEEFLLIEGYVCVKYIDKGSFKELIRKNKNNEFNYHSATINNLNQLFEAPSKLNKN